MTLYFRQIARPNYQGNCTSGQLEVPSHTHASLMSGAGLGCFTTGPHPDVKKGEEEGKDNALCLIVEDVQLCALMIGIPAFFPTCIHLHCPYPCTYLCFYLVTYVSLNLSAYLPSYLTTYLHALTHNSGKTLRQQLREIALRPTCIAHKDSPTQPCHALLIHSLTPEYTWRPLTKQRETRRVTTLAGQMINLSTHT